jgi:hypothetical protein
VSVGTEQLQSVLPLLTTRPLLLADRHYSQDPWLLATAELPLDLLIRARADQVLYRPPPPRSGKQGRPRKDGARFKGTDPSTHGQPYSCWSGNDSAGKPLSVRCFRLLHRRGARHLSITAIQIVREQAPNTKREPREAWFWWLGGALPPLAELAGYYPHRFGQEHGYRFDKQDMLWAAPLVRTPEQMQRWTDVVAMVRNQLVLARPLVEADRRAWEARTRAATPQQVRRAMGRLIAQVGMPVPAPQVRGKAPGRAVGAVVKSAERCAVVRKTAPQPKAARKSSSPGHKNVQRC